MNSQTATTYRRRGDGVLEIVPKLSRAEAGKGVEIAISVLFIAIGASATLTRNLALGVILLAGGAAMLANRIVRDLRARAARQRLQVASGRSDERVGLRVIRREEGASNEPSAPAAAVRIPGTAASPRE